MSPRRAFRPLTRRALLHKSVGAISAVSASPLLFAVSPAVAAPSRNPIGVTFFAASWCPFCKGAAAVLKGLADQGHIALLTISLDAKPIGALTEFAADSGEAAAMGVSGVPVTLIFDPVSAEPVARIDGFRGYGPYLAKLRAAASAIEGVQQ